MFFVKVPLQRIPLLLDNLIRRRQPRRHPLDHLPFLRRRHSRSRLVARGHPLCAVPRLALWVVVHQVDLLERQALGFVVEKEDDEHCEEVAPGKDVAVLVPDAVDDEGREEGEQEVPDPVAGRGEGGAVGADAEGEDFANCDPDAGSPCGREARLRSAGKMLEKE